MRAHIVGIQKYLITKNGMKITKENHTNITQYFYRNKIERQTYNIAMFSIKQTI